MFLFRKILFRLTRPGSVVLVLYGLAAGTNLKAQTVTNSILYQLNTDSSFAQGCFPPCLCPVMITAPMKGTFLLTPTGFDGLFDTYAVTEVSWSVSINGTNMIVTGSGTYKLGGEVALQQELSLDLQMDGGKSEPFDSGLVAESAVFPQITATISTNRLFCFDTAFNVNASPVQVPQSHLAFGSSNSIVLSWPVSAIPFTLQESSNLTVTNWTVVTNAVTVTGNQNQVVLTRSPGNRFYRLHPSAD